MTLEKGFSVKNIQQNMLLNLLIVLVISTGHVSNTRAQSSWSIKVSIAALKFATSMYYELLG